MRALRLDPLVDPRWRALVDRSPQAGVFAHPAWLSLLARQYRYPVTALAVGDDASLAAGLPLARVESRLTGRRLVALPFSDFCAPITDAQERLVPLGKALLDEHGRSGLRVEVRWALDGLPGAHVVPRFLHHRLAIPEDLEPFERGLRSQVRRNINKARREGVLVEAATDRAALETFYELHLRTRRRQGVPTQPKSFILGFQELFRQDLGFVLVARHEGRPLAAAVFLTSGDTMLYKYGASDERHLELRPNNLLFREAIGLACERGLRWLDFGRTDFGHDGLRSFKLGWGSDEREISYTYLGSVPDDGDGRASRLLARAVRKGPLWLGRGVGTALYRHMG